MTTYPVSERALVQRISRRLTRQGERLRKGRGRWATELGYYIVDVGRNFLVEQNCDLETLGRELGVLEEWESLAPVD